MLRRLHLYIIEATILVATLTAAIKFIIFELTK